MTWVGDVLAVLFWVTLAVGMLVGYLHTRAVDKRRAAELRRAARYPIGHPNGWALRARPPM